MQISELRQGHRVRVTLKNGDTFDVDVQRATHAPKISSIVDVTFADGSEGLMWSRTEGVTVNRFGWGRSHAVVTMSIVYNAVSAFDLALATAICNGTVSR